VKTNDPGDDGVEGQGSRLPSWSATAAADVFDRDGDGGGGGRIECGLWFGWRTGNRGKERRTGDNDDGRASRRKLARAVAAQGDRGLEERRGDR
jgi:hypothetical protein